VCTNCGETKVVDKGCKRRWCPCCVGKITAQRLSRFAFAGSQLQWPLAVTLTMPNTANGGTCIKELRKALSRFRRTPLWGGKVSGGVCSIEVTNTGKGWHPHAHLLVDARWLSLTTRAPRSSDSRAVADDLKQRAHAELSEAWAKCLHIPQAVVWVERAWGKALLETIKYVVKPADLLECRGKIGPLIHSMHHARMVNGFGTCYGMTKEWRKEERAARPACQCESCLGIGTITPESAIRGRQLERMEQHAARHAAEVAWVMRNRKAQRRMKDIPF
jgi:Replication protein